MMTVMLVLLTLLFVAGIALAAAVGIWRTVVRWDKGMVRARAEIAWRALFPARSLKWDALERRCLSRMRSCVTISVGGVSIVPTAFRIGLHPDDLARMEGVRSFVEADLASSLSSEARRHRWRCDAPPTVTVFADLAAQSGFPQVEAFFGSDAGGSSAALLADPARSDANPQGRSLTDRLPRTPTTAEGLGSSRTEPWSLIELASMDASHPDIDMSDLTGALVLGRGPTCDVVLDGATVSDEHAVLRRTRAGWEVEDLGSRNGTFRNGQRMEGSVLLLHGDYLSFSQRGPRFRYAQLDRRLPARARRTSR